MPDTPSDQPTPDQDGRRGQRRRLRSGPTDRSHLYPDVAQAVPEDQALPGELRLLAYAPGRTHPVTDEEALGVARRKYRTDIASGKERVDPLPDALPPHDTQKASVHTRLAARVVSLMQARAELEGTNSANVLDEYALRYALGVPENPQEAGQRQREFLRWFTDGAQGTPPPDTSPTLISPEHEQALYEEAARRGISARQLLAEILGRALP